MIANSVIKADFTAFLKAQATLTVLLASNKEVQLSTKGLSSHIPPCGSV